MSDEAATVDPATPRPPPSPRQLKRARAECKSFVAEARRLRGRYAQRMDPKHVEEIDLACIGLEQASASGDLERIAAALERLDGLVESHLGFARGSPAREYASSIGTALIIAIVLRLFVVEAFKIPSGSMIPTLLIGDHLFVNKLSYGLRLPVVSWELLHWGGYRRGDVVVFAHPREDELPVLERRDYIKRIVGLPGETIEVKDEVLYVDGMAQPRELLQSRHGYFDRPIETGPWEPREAELWQETLPGASGEPGVVHPVLRDPARWHASHEGPFVVPPGHLFMMGDNRDNSQDGRFGGWFVPFGHVKGRATVIWLSWGKPGVGGRDGQGLRVERFFKSVR